MSNAEQNPCLAPRNTVVHPREVGRTPSLQSFNSDDDHVVWPPIIARIRDLDKPVVPENPPPCPAPETRTPLKSLRAKISAQRRNNQSISSRLIALAGIIIFLVAIVPFMHLRDNKSNSESAGTAMQPTPPAPISDLASPWPGGTATTAESTGKTSSQSLSSPSAELTTKAKSAAGIAPGVPPLLPAPEKKGSLGSLLASPSPAKAANTMIGTPIEQIATQPAAIRAGASAQTNTSGVASPLHRPNVEAEHVVEIIGEYEPLPSAPNSNVSSPYASRPTATGPENNNRGDYRRADVRDGYRNSYNPTPYYRMNPPTNNNNPNALPPGAGNAGVGGRDGYSIPPVTENPPPRYQESYR
jgi:hypothetical protein